MKVALGPNAKEVEIPDDYVKNFDAGKMNRGGLFDYAISTGQGRPSDFGLEESKPEVSGPGQAAMISAGGAINKLGSNINQAAAQMGGNQAGVDAEVAKQGQIDQSLAPVSEQFPKASLAGEVLPGFAVPGGKIAQMGAGAAQGALQGDSTPGRVGNAALGALAAFAGGKIGDKISGKVVPAVQGLMGSKLAAPRAALEKAGVPLTLGQKGSAAGKFVDVLKSTLFRTNPLQKQQITQLNKMAAKALGENADDLSKQTLGDAATRIGNVFESVAKDIGPIDAIGPETAQRFTQVDDLMKSVPEPSKVTGIIDMVQDTIMSPDKGLTGKSYLALRQRMGKVSRQLWSAGNGLEAEVVDELIDTLDDALARQAPEAAEKLATAGQQWKFLLAVRRGQAVDDLGNINPRAMAASLEAKYPGFDIGRTPPGAAGEFGNTLDAYNQVVKPFRSSGTTERLAGIAAPVAAGLGLAGMGTPALGGAAGLATMLMGGGAGRQIGGGMGRALAQQAQPVVDPAAQALAQKLRQIR